MKYLKQTLYSCYEQCPYMPKVLILIGTCKIILALLNEELSPLISLQLEPSLPSDLP